MAENFTGPVFLAPSFFRWEFYMFLSSPPSKLSFFIIVWGPLLTSFSNLYNMHFHFCFLVFCHSSIEIFSNIRWQICIRFKLTPFKGPWNSLRGDGQDSSDGKEHRGRTNWSVPGKVQISFILGSFNSLFVNFGFPNYSLSLRPSSYLIPSSFSPCLCL